MSRTAKATWVVVNVVAITAIILILYPNPFVVAASLVSYGAGAVVCGTWLVWSTEGDR